MNYSQHKEQKVGVFVDVQNMYYSAKNLYQAKVDFGRVLQTGLSGRRLIRAFAYVIKADVGAEKEFFGALEKIGFEVKEKELQIFYGGSKKGDWDVGLCMDVVRMIPKIDTMVLVSGDGDYYDLIDYARSQGVKTEVIAFGETTSNRLIENADLFTDMSSDKDRFLIRDRRAKLLDKLPGNQQNRNTGDKGNNVKGGRENVSPENKQTPNPNIQTND